MIHQPHRLCFTRVMVAAVIVLFFLLIAGLIILLLFAVNTPATKPSRDRKRGSSANGIVVRNQFWNNKPPGSAGGT